MRRLALLLLLIPSLSFGATEFTATVMESGGDYAHLSSAEAGLQNDLTAATIKVFSISAYSSTLLTAASTVHGIASSATAVVVLENKARTQVLLKTITGTFQSGELVRQVGATANTVTLADAGDSPIVGMNISGTWTTADTLAVVIAGWTTSATNYIKVYTSGAARHSGKFGESGDYKLSVANANALKLNEEFIRVDGLQVEVNAANANAQYPITIDVIAAGGSEVWVDNCVVRTHDNATYYTRALNSDDADLVALKVRNGIFLHRGGTGTSDVGVYLYNSGAYIGNCTIYGGYRAFRSAYASPGTIYLRNTLGANSSNADFVFTAGPTFNVDYCASEDATADDAGAASNHINHTFSFTDAINSDFHLAVADTGAKGLGVSMVSDPNIPYSTDIDGQTPSPWSIGADSFPATATGGRRRWVLQ